MAECERAAGGEGREGRKGRESRESGKLRILEITDFDAPELDIYARLNENQLARFYEPRRGIFIAESPKVIGRALDAGYEPLSFLADSKALETAGEERQLLERCCGLPVYAAGDHVLTRLTGFHLTRGLLCAMRRPRLLAVEEVCRNARRVAVLEHVANPTNVGAIFRSAAALGMDAVLLTPDCSDPLYRRAARVSMGTVFQIPWTYFPEGHWPGRGLLTLSDLGFRTAAMALREDSIGIDDRRLREAGRLALILGAEGDGLADVTIDGCDYTVRIPMAHGVDSLNVAAASAVAFWELRA